MPVCLFCFVGLHGARVHSNQYWGTEVIPGIRRVGGIGDEVSPTVAEFYIGCVILFWMSIGFEKLVLHALGWIGYIPYYTSAQVVVLELS